LSNLCETHEVEEPKNPLVNEQKKVTERKKDEKSHPGIQAGSSPRRIPLKKLTSLMADEKKKGKREKKVRQGPSAFRAWRTPLRSGVTRVPGIRKKGG